MRVEKEKRKVAINCEGGLLVKGSIYLNQGERVSDFLNNSRENFIAVTNAEFNSTKEIESLKLFINVSKKRSAIILNKTAIKFVEEL